MPQVALGQFQGMITTFRNRTILIAMQPVVTLLQELASNDEFQNRAGTDDTTKRHIIQLLKACDKARRMITFNPEGVDIKSVVDIDKELGASERPLFSDTIQLGSTPPVEIPWKFDGTDPNIPLLDQLRFRNGVGGLIYGAACEIAVAWTRLESRNRSQMITVNDSVRMFSLLQSVKDMCDRLLGENNQIDIAQPLATDEPAGMVSPNRVNEGAVSILKDGSK